MNQTNSDKRGDILAYGALGLMVLVVIMGFTLILLKVEPTNASGTLIIQIISAVISIAGIVYGFQFGSSKGSQDKNATIANQANPPPSPPLDASLLAQAQAAAAQGTDKFNAFIQGLSAAQQSALQPNMQTLSAAASAAHPGPATTLAIKPVT